MKRVESEKRSASTIPNTRIEWMDVFKGIMIVLVVLGHATSSFNGWIYQFHMAAFFFASGYLSNVEKKGGLSLAVKKALTIFLPFLTLSIVGILANWIINKFGAYDILFGSPFIGAKTAISELFTHGLLYVQYWGTFWFLVALLGIELLQLVLFQLCGKRLNVVYFLVCVGLFFYGYWMVLNSVTPKLGIFELDLIFIGQGYFNAGLFLRKINIKDYIDKMTGSIVVFVVAVIVSLWGSLNGIVVDYPSRNFSHPFGEFFVAFASIYIVYFVSKLISGYVKPLKSVLALLGKNSLGIMVLHFIFFKLFMVALYKGGLATREQITNVILPSELQIVGYWLPMAIIAILGSLLIWILLGKIPGIKFVLGQDAKTNAAICRRVEANRFVIAAGTKLSVRISKFWNWIDAYVRENKVLSGAIALLIVLFAVPMYRTGIIINDELQARCLAMQGFATFYKTEFMTWISQGRLLAAPINSFTKWLSFIGAGSGTTFRLGSIIILLAVVCSFGVFIYKALKNKWFAIFTAVFSLACMPIAFEHSSPNAFVGFIALPFMLVLISNAIYVTYLETNKKKYAVISMCLFFLAMMSYEAFITFTVLYLFVVFGKTGIKNIKRSIKLYLIPICTAIAFLTCYMVCSHLAPSGYDGNQLGFSSIFEPLKIISNLFVACIPGFFVFFSRYKDYKQLYFNLTAGDYIRIALFVAMFAVVSTIIIKKLLNSEDKKQIGKSSTRDILKHTFIIFCGLSYMIFPSLPNSIASMYQGIVGFDGNFLTLPVTFFEYFAASFVICYLIWLIIRSVGGKFYVIAIALMCLLAVNIQGMNDIFSKEQNKNFNRLVDIEDFLQTDTVRNLAIGEYYAADLYKQQNSLAVLDGYWSGYCNKVIGVSIHLTAEHDGTEVGNFYYDDDNFVIVDAQNIIVLSKDQETKSKAVRIDDYDYAVFDFESANVSSSSDHDYYVYTMPNDGSVFSKVGYKPISGYYADRWLESVSKFSVTTGESGVISGQLYYPGTALAGKKVDVYLNDTLIQTIDINDNTVDFKISLDPDSSGTLKFQCNFEYEEKDTGDIRSIAILLLKMQVQ